MSKKPVSQKRAQRQQEERAALNNIFNTFLIGLAAECYLFIVYRGYVVGSVDSFLLWSGALDVFRWLGLAALVGGIMFAIWKKADPKKSVLGIGTACTGLFLAATSWIVKSFFDVGALVMCAVVPALTVLALIFFLYQRECFVSTASLAAALLAVWVCGRGLGGGGSIYAIIVAVGVLVMIAVCTVLAFKARSAEGKLFGRQIFAPGSDYRMLYIVAAVSALLVVLALVLPSVTYYLIWAAVVALFAELAYYTTKLM